MSPMNSAGILLYRASARGTEVLLGHLGGPFWRNRDIAAWSIPKGEFAQAETPKAAARREFTEELGVPVPAGQLVELGWIRQSGGKVVTGFALRGDLDPAAVVLGTFEMEWPKGSDRTVEVPELDRVAWFGAAAAREKMIAAQRVFLDRLTALAEH